MRNLVAVLALMCLCQCSTAFARLGETENQLTNRYGAIIQTEVLSNGLRKLTFNFGDYYMLAYCRDGRSVTEFAYLKKRGVEFKEDVALAIASMISGSTNWVSMESKPWQKTWGVKNPQLFAMLSTEPGQPQSIMVSTPAEVLRNPPAKLSPKKLAPGF